MGEKCFSKREPLYKVVLILLSVMIIFSGCGKNNPTNNISVHENTPIPTATIHVTDEPFSVCNLLTEEEKYQFFLESPLISVEENGGCRVSNQWETRSLVFVITQAQQADQAVRYFTAKLDENWNDPDINSLISTTLESGTALELNAFIQSTQSIYRALEYRWEPLLTIGDSAIFHYLPDAATAIIEVVDSDRYIRVGLYGFSINEAREKMIEVVKIIAAVAPNPLELPFAFVVEENSVSTTEGNLDEIPSVSSVLLSRKEIYFGDLCGDESTLLLVTLRNQETVNQVYFIYRLESETETNPNWTTVTMTKGDNQEWTVNLSAEKNFSAYQLVNAARVNYGIAVIYRINQVYRSPEFNDLIIYQCNLELKPKQ
ncbi:MAG: hypothetical protein CVU39_15555 [Chloroflexi bacterium HGW-Chloroflexi-10]|nr:MAG: hypothetical protein CVU39_15555 [Chloroflexi bacterium HGW-Chloroflexi-10]